MCQQIQPINQEILCQISPIQLRFSLIFAPSNLYAKIKTVK
uniref:Uncharacterized protein n=1 Tax=Rhizophora mucronata TaxID=61149 RepID=A0A2P2MZ00_RHIMU